VGSSLSKSEAVVKYVPFLRRYARALTGAQSSGDAYVSATLEAWLEDPSLGEGGRNPRVTLFQLFTKIWKSVALNKTTEAADNAPAPEQRLLNLTPQPRQAFLLLTLEGFSENEAAQILDCDIPTLRRLVDTCGRELAAELATDVLIIEDEVLIAIDLETLVTGLGHRVIGAARTHAEAIQLAQEKQPGLILADIQLADGSSGLDAVNEMMRSFEAPVIFITAYPERFLTGERPEPAFLISKPFQPAMVSALASQALFFARGGKPSARATAQI
jgi:DNA-directed RNA polymerase specialized sigma24 family protein/CheY-like chemotaxis protein